MLSINISEMILTIISFFLLMFLLKKLLFDPVISFMEARQARIDAALDEARLADERLQQAESENEQQLEQVRQNAARMIADGKTKDEQSLVETAGILDRKAESASAAARLEMAKLREKSITELKELSPGLSELLAGKLLGE